MFLGRSVLIRRGTRVSVPSDRRLLTEPEMGETELVSEVVIAPRVRRAIVAIRNQNLSTQERRANGPTFPHE